MKCPNCGVELLANMKRCPKCGFDLLSGHVDYDYLERRSDRQSAEKAEKEEIERLQKEQQYKEEHYDEIMEQARSKLIISTTPTIDGYHITKYLGVRSYDSIVETGYESRTGEKIGELLGLRSNVVLNQVGSAKRRAYTAFLNACVEAGANAAIGVVFNLTALNIYMMVATVSGTAVIVEKDTKKVLPIRSKERNDIIKCPECGKIQKSVNKICESCGARFI